MKIDRNNRLFRGPGILGLNRSQTAAPSSGPVKNDQTMLSKQALLIVQMQNKIRAIEQARENAENSPEAKMLENLKKSMDILKTCTTIAARLRAGDHVPLKDLQYLKRYDPQGYQLAMASRKPKVHPKEWKSAIPEEEQASSDSRSAESAETSAPEMSSLSGDTGGSTEGGV